MTERIYTMKRKFLPLVLTSLLVGMNLVPAISYADEVTTNITNDTSTETVETTTDSTTSSSDETEQTASTEETETTTSTDSSSTEKTESTETTESSQPEQIVTPTPTNNEPSQTIDSSEPTSQNEQSNNTEQVIHLSKNEQTETFIRKIGEKARAVGQKHNIYASVMIAQAILESGSGNSDLSQEPNYNLFGIKGLFEGKSVSFPTQEDDGTGHWYTIDAIFKKYPDYTKSFEDYAKLIKEGIDSNPTVYAGVWKENALTYKEATQALTGVYATDTTYNKKLDAFIEEYELTEYDKEKPSTSVSGIIVSDTHPDSDFPDYTGQTYAGAESYAAGNCTQYVYNRILQLDGAISTTMGNGMDWGASGKTYGYDVSNTPKAGTAVSFQPSVAGADKTYGHVAFVEHVYPDGSILISEMNAAGLGIVSFRIIDANTVSLLTYITPK